MTSGGTVGQPETAQALGPFAVRLDGVEGRLGNGAQARLWFWARPRPLVSHLFRCFLFLRHRCVKCCRFCSVMCPCEARTGRARLGTARGPRVGRGTQGSRGDPANQALYQPCHLLTFFGTTVKSVAGQPIYERLQSCLYPVLQYLMLRRDSRTLQRVPTRSTTYIVSWLSLGFSGASAVGWAALLVWSVLFLVFLV